MTDKPNPMLDAISRAIDDTFGHVTRPTDHWDLRFMQLAAHIAAWSKDPSTKTGAVIVNRVDHKVFGLGYNGFPRGVADDDRLNDRPTKYKLVVHCEANAILNASGNTRGSTMYTTKFPCTDCAKLIVQSGIVGVFAIKSQPANASDQRWAEDALMSRTMMLEAGIELYELDLLGGAL